VNKHQVDRPFTDDLIRDVNVAALGVVGCRDHCLVPSAPPFSPMVTVLRKSEPEDQYINAAFLDEPTWSGFYPRHGHGRRSRFTSPARRSGAASILPEFLTAAGTFLTALVALISVGVIILRESPHITWTYLVLIV